MGYIPKLSGGKRLLIDKANATMLLTIGITSFIVVFSLIASRALLSQSGYQARVLSEKQKAHLKRLADFRRGRPYSEITRKNMIKYLLLIVQIQK